MKKVRLVAAAKTEKQKAAPRQSVPAKVENVQSKKIDTLLSEINKKLGGLGVVARGTQIRCLDADRIATGVTGIDYLLNGGLPRGMLVQFKGAESTGKTTTALKACAKIVREGGAVAWLASEGFSKTWARKAGVLIPYDSKELETIFRRYGDDGVEKAEIYNENCVGVFTLGLATTGDKLLDVAIELILSNLYDLVVIDSIAHLSNSKEIEGEMGDQTRGGNASMLGKFCRVVNAIANGQDSAAIKWDLMSDAERAAAEKKGNSKPERSKTAIVVINQLRDRGFSGVPMAPDAPGGWGLKHAKVADVKFQLDDHLFTGAKKDLDERYVFGRRVVVTTTKCKIGPEGRVCYLDIYTEDFGGVKAGDFDRAGDILRLAVKFDLIAKSGAWFNVGDDKFQGEESIKKWLRANPEIMDSLSETILKVSKSM